MRNRGWEKITQGEREEAERDADVGSRFVLMEKVRRLTGFRKGRIAGRLCRNCGGREIIRIKPGRGKEEKDDKGFYDAERVFDESDKKVANGRKHKNSGVLRSYSCTVPFKYLENIIRVGNRNER